MPRTQDDWIRKYQVKGALWIHDGNVKRPHALLTSGMHSNGFFNSKLVIQDEALLREAAVDLINLFITKALGNTHWIDGIVGPQTGATDLAKFMSEEIEKLTKRPCFFASPAKAGEGDAKSMVFSEAELVLLPNKAMLLCEDVLTTGGSVELTATAVLNASGIVTPFILVLVNRSNFVEIDGKNVVALINRPMPMWESEECPLCKEGSEAIRPKDNWAALNATY